MWPSIVGMKMIAIIFKKFLKHTMLEQMLVSPFGMIMSLCESLVTFGSDNFLDFISAYFIEFGIMIFERCYLGNIEEAFFVVVEKKLPKLLKDFTNWLNNEV
jgi:hypothetical protein